MPHDAKNAQITRFPRGAAAPHLHQIDTSRVYTLERFI